MKDGPAKKKVVPSVEKKMRVNIGWQHKYTHDSEFICLRSKDGGGTHYVHVQSTATITELSTEAMKIFMKNTTAKHIFDISTNCCIGQADGTVIKEFTDLDEKLCDIKTCLSARGLYPSRTNIYLLSSARISVTVDENSNKSMLDNVIAVSEQAIPNNMFELRRSIEVGVHNESISSRAMEKHSKPKLTIEMEEQMNREAHSSGMVEQTEPRSSGEKVKNN